MQSLNEKERNDSDEGIPVKGMPGDRSQRRPYDETEQRAYGEPERKKTETSIQGQDNLENRLKRHPQDVRTQSDSSSKWQTSWWNKPPYGPVSERYVQWRT
jgi:hypothetical protein